MSAGHITCALVAWAILSLSSPVLAAIQLTEVVSGLSSPLFVGHAGDGSQRLFIEEQAGIIKVLQPGSTVPTVFLDISDAQRELGYAPRYSNEKAICESYDWYIANRNSIRFEGMSHHRSAVRKGILALTPALLKLLPS
jgi:hypothetical protein